MYTTLNPVCTSCQTTLGHVYPIYYRILAKRIRDTVDKKGYNLEEIGAVMDVSMGDILDKCNLTNACCRMHMMSHNRIVRGSI